MRPQSVLFAVLVPLIVLVGPALVAQQAPSESKTSPSEPPLQKHFYKLTFRLRESDDAKVVNQRDFILNISAAPVHVGGVPPDWWNVRSGTRIPVAVTNKEGKDFNYVDVGVNLDVRAEEAPDGLQLQVTADISSVAGEGGLGSNAPAVRQVKVRSAVVAPVGKPTLVFTADDASSRHRFELEVTPQLVK
jgi:hypothetical protein